MRLDTVTVMVEPCYYQFYLRRGEAELSADEISEEGYEAHLEAVAGFVYVGTASYHAMTDLSIEVHDGEPAPEPDQAERADRIVEVSVGGSGSLAVLNWDEGDEPVAVVETPEGPLRLRVIWSGTAAAEDDPDVDVPGGPSFETLRLVLWPAPEQERTVLKAWQPDPAAQ